MGGKHWPVHGAGGGTHISGTTWWGTNSRNHWIGQRAVRI